jgi:hypothetical protein
MRKSRLSPETLAYLRAIAARGGRAGTGSAKRRPAAHYKKAGAAGGRAKARAMREKRATESGK